MAYIEEYYGEFMSQGGTLWRVEIWQKGEDGQTAAAARELSFPYDTPLTIEWDTKELEEPLCGAVATLTVVSEDDRQFTGYYRTALCATQLRVYRGGYIFWVGTLNTEEYSEPFQTFDGYETSLTFSDLAQGEFVKFQPRAQVDSIYNMLFWLRNDLGLSISENTSDPSDTTGYVHPMMYDNYATLGESAYGVLEMYNKEGDPKTYGGHGNIYSLMFLAANYYDRDSQSYKTWQEVLSDVCRALGARIMQWWGLLVFYTPDGLFNADGTAKTGGGSIYWTGDEQTLEMGKVYNNIKVTVTPSESALTLLTGEDDDTPMQGSGGSISVAKPVNTYDTQTVSLSAAPPNTMTVRTAVSGEVQTLNDSRLLPVEIAEGNDGMGERKALLYHAANCAEMTLARARCATPEGDISSGGVCVDRFATWHTAGGSQIFPKRTKLFTSRPFFLMGSDLATRVGYKVGVNVPLLCTCLQCPTYDTMPDVISEKTDVAATAYTDKNGLVRHAELTNAAPLLRAPYTILVRNDKGQVVCYLASFSQSTTPLQPWAQPVWQTVAAPSDTDPYIEMPAFLMYSGVTKYTAENGKSRAPSSYSLGKGFDDCSWTEDVRALYSIYNEQGESELSPSASMELLPAPPVSGMAELVVFEGVFMGYSAPNCADPYKETVYPAKDEVELIAEYKKAEPRSEYGSMTTFLRSYKFLRWIAYGLPQVRYVNPQTFDEVDPEGKEYATAVDPTFKNEFAVETCLGSPASLDNLGIGTFCRRVTNAAAGTEKIEAMPYFRNKNLGKGLAADWDVLPYVVAAQWHSQYDTAKILLSGESRLPEMGRLLLTEEHYPGKMFIVKGGTLTALTDTFDATYQEVSPTQYARERG